VRTARSRVTVEARAKVNLGLAVGPRRDDGFHELAGVFQSVSLADTLTITRARSGFSIAVTDARAESRGRISAEHRASLPRGRANLVIAAAQLLRSRRGLTGGARFRLVKRIPQRAGLGGGSADAAAALVGLARLYGLTLTRDDRLSLAAALGSDVPFAVTGGTALVRGRGERLTSLRLAGSFRAVIAVPSWSISTPDAYRALDRRRNSLTRWRSNLRFAQVLGQEHLRPERAMHLGNSFEAALGHHREKFLSLQRRLKDAGARTVRLTGSGSAVLGLLPNAARPAEVMRRFQGDEALYLVRSVSRGFRFVTRS